MATTKITSDNITDGAITSAKLDTNIAVGGTLTVTGDANFDSNTLFVDASANAVGIGTSSPTDKLNISSGTNQIGLDTGNQATYGTLDIGHFTNGAFIGTQAGSNAASNILRFGTSGSERMRVLSTGSVLFGQTLNDRPAEFTQPTGASIAGASGYLHGQYQSSVSGMNMLLNRKGTDGTILGFRKDGADVGSIGYNSGNGFYMHTPFGNDSGLVFGSERIVPCTSTGAFDDAVVDLGYSSGRFKDLYLSGGVVFNVAGGTGTSTSGTLDDYEEGTWTPVLSKSTTAPSVTYNTQNGTYTKVGRMIYVSGLLSWTAISGGTGDFRITGLPFTILSSAGAYPQLVSTDYNGVTFGANDTTFGGFGIVNGTQIVFLAAKNNGTPSTAISGLATSGFIYFNLTYQAA